MDSSERLFRTVIATLRQYDKSLHLSRRLVMFGLTVVASMLGVTTADSFDSFDDEG